MNRVLVRLFKHIFPVLIAAFLAGCSSSGPNYLRKSLANAGPVMLSRDNPYIVGNLFLSNEQNLSSIMDGFVKHRGKPDAIEVAKHWFKPLRIYFFYLDSQEAYLFEENGADWVVRGPERIPEDVLSKFPAARLAARLAAPAYESRSPALDEQESEDYGAQSGAAPEKQRVKIPEWNRRNSKTKQPDYGERSPEETEPYQPPKPAKKRTPAKESNLPPPKDFSDSFPDDVIHRVRYQRETLRLIAGWYTDSPDNAGRIARMNGIGDPNRLEMGQEVRIPGYLLRRSEPLPESEVERYRSEKMNTGAWR